MTTVTDTLTPARLAPRQPVAVAVRRGFAPAASLLVAASVVGAGLRVALVVALPVLLLGALAHRVPRGPRALVLFLLAALALGAGVIVQGPLLLVAAPLYAIAATHAGWGVNRGRRRRRAWMYRALSALAIIPVSMFVLLPLLQAVNFLAKPN